MDDFKVRTRSGGVVSIIGYAIMIALFMSELQMYLSNRVETKLVVDNSRGEGMSIYMDIQFPKISCNLLGIDALDMTGNAQLEISHDLYKIRTDQSGEPIVDQQKDKVVPKTSMRESKDKELEGDEMYCGSCYGASSGCCNSCDEVKEAYEARGWMVIDLKEIEQCVKEGAVVDNELVAGEGCLVKGKVDVPKVAGNLHISPGHSFDFHGEQLHDNSAFDGNSLNLSHRINRLSYGDSFPGQKNPLDETDKTLTDDEPLGMHEYFVKIVPTTYKKASGEAISSNQYSVTEYFRPGEATPSGTLLPGVYFFYDMSPIKVEVTETRKPFLGFIVQLCAIIGGIFTVMGMIDASVYHGGKVIRKKLQLGKAD
eukprot:CAMPEP_0184740444 /NCGR_PEP_ID=MMETSP0315-20130426/3470_1 /TAXON_ID=101924 /ORGANISM="Rhodosorus marinus, Strain UTEX LB 2760" /LENGTH=368 /DNA_ID=CAMNT_0027210129 /DNA_START=192 /DNA_END=1298 /DNA_ORIENTATION=-